jgi:hypothetical protein
MNTIFQQSIQKTRNKVYEVCRLIAATKKRAKKDDAQATTRLELLLDEICAETGLKMSEENLPTIMLFVQQFITDQQKRKSNSNGVDPDGMSDFPL